MNSAGSVCVHISILIKEAMCLRGSAEHTGETGVGEGRLEMVEQCVVYHHYL